MRIKIDFDENKAFEKINRNIGMAQKALDSKVLADSNYFCPQDTSTLQKSAEIHSRIGSGLLVWQTPYADNQYNGEHFDHSKQRNPNATAKWFETAKARFKEEWVKLVQSIFNKN